MRAFHICALLASLCFPGFVLLHAEPLAPSQKALEKAEVICQFATPSGDRMWNAPAEGAASPFEIDCRIPSGAPAFLLFDSQATEDGRLIIHLGARELPAALTEKAPERDWANPKRRFDFRSVLSLAPGPWQTHLVSLNEDFFEAVSKQKLPYDLGGTEISTLGIEVNQPASEDQTVRIRNVRFAVLTAPSQKVDLLENLEELQERLRQQDKDSSLFQHWEGVLKDLASGVHAFDPMESGTDQWRKLSQEMQRIKLASRLWPLLAECSSGYCVGIESSLRRVASRHPGLTFEGSLSRQVDLRMARNEYESFQIVLLPAGKPLTDVQVRVEDLRSNEGSHVISRDNIEIFHQIEQFVQPSLGTANDWVGWIPDALDPISGSFDTGPEETKPLWVTVHVPPNAPAGEYRGSLRVKPENGREQVITLALHVQDFQIPITGQFRTQGHLSLEGLEDWYREDYSPEVRRNFYRQLLRHRMTPTSQYSARLSPDPADIPWILEQGGNVILIGGFSGRDLDEEIIGPAYDWLVENDAIDQAIIYIGDETNDFEGMKGKARTIRRKWPKLRIMIGGSKPRPEIVGFMDVWDPITYGGDVYDFDPVSTQEAIARGEEMFWYTCVGPKMPFANVYNDHPLTAIRALWWQAWKYGVTGFEYWWYNWWQPNLELSRIDPPWPRSKADTWNSRSFEWANGDGLLVYPGPGGTALPSIRLSVMRDAIEDWEVLFLLKRAAALAEQRKDPALASQLKRAEILLQVPDPLTSDLMNWSDQPRDYSQARSELYDLLQFFVESLGKKEFEEHTAKWIREHTHWKQQQFLKRVKNVPEE
ncbi:MAG: DUF4091 domain-containing protein [Acidobacteriota bacterium]|nr:MAG: DUF4091 domain-containing protein [Acidobacteriota bacterium]